MKPSDDCVCNYWILHYVGGPADGAMEKYTGESAPITRYVVMDEDSSVAHWYLQDRVDAAAVFLKYERAVKR